MGAESRVIYLAGSEQIIEPQIAGRGGICNRGSEREFTIK